MQTEALIDSLVADARRVPARWTPSWSVIAALAVAGAGAAFFLALGPRADFMQAAETVSFLFKFVVAAALAASSFVAMKALARPGGNARTLRLVLLPASLLVLAVLLELATVPAGQWAHRLFGANGLMCMAAIPALGTLPLALFLWMLHRQAPTRPALAGATAGLAAAALAAFFYAARCTDDSPLFVAFWYPLGSLVLVLPGAVIGRRLLRW